jgi:hypothetical protein
MAEDRPYIDDILAAVREGRVGAATAAEWLELRAAEHAREARRARARAPQVVIPSLGEMSNEEADALLPPRTAEEFERRAMLADVRAAAVEELAEAELYDVLFPLEYRRRSPGGGGG